ncbi:uncharacterized protein LOC129590920 [Paramacrobiotus metropolitanus]|uniref:uncharacterized protein LOC129590920 n=1 Tax=Paramacrobiotus metropolitanus TaxID=2943436 RepID=UPI0024456CA1|nr:uncharacterized protein LOC129590920 [Paramacrobiotus metropolitanus]
MHIFAGSGNSAVVYDVYQWNSVDALISGTLQRGVVIGLATAGDGTPGVLIDLDCPQRHCEFVEYGSIFRCPCPVPGSWKRWKEPALAESHPLQALLRVGGDRAWTWWPAKLALLADAQLRKASCSHIECGLVEVQWGDAVTVTKELIPLNQIRGAPDDLKGRRVGQDYFASSECRLPSGYWSAPAGATRLLWQKISHNFSACCITIRSETFTYFQRNEELPISPVSLDSTFDYIVRHQSALYTDRSDNGERQESKWDRSVLPLRKVKAPPTEEHRTSRGIPLPREILAEIFQSLDSIERVRKRRVCRLWEAMLDANATGKHLWIACRHPFLQNRWLEGEQFVLAVCMLRGATSTTDTIVLEDSKELAYFSRDVFGLLTDLLQQQRITTLVLSRCVFSDHDFEYEDYMEKDYLDWINDLLSAMAATCRVVVWRNCPLTMLTNSVQVTYVKLRLLDAPAHRLTQLWDVYERSLVSHGVVGHRRCAAACRVTGALSSFGCWHECAGADPRTARGVTTVDDG